MQRLGLWFLLFIGVTTNAFCTDLREVLEHPDRFESRRMTFIGIARVPGYFWLCPDKKTATEKSPNPDKALLVRTTVKQGEYRELDRQWVEVTGIVSGKFDNAYGWGPVVSGWRAAILLKSIRPLHDRPSLHIKDATVWAVFKNDTSLPIKVEVSGLGFWLAPREAAKEEIDEGRASAFGLKGPSSVRLDKRQTGKRIATGEIRLRSMPPGWEYSPELSAPRTVYYRIVEQRIEPVAASEGRRWKHR